MSDAYDSALYAVKRFKALGLIDVSDEDGLATEIVDNIGVETEHKTNQRQRNAN